MAIIIYLNGKKEEIENGANISMLLEAKNIRPEVVTVELNDEIIAKDKYRTTVLKPDDKLEFVYYMGGGDSTQSLSAISYPLGAFISTACAPPEVRFIAPPAVRTVYRTSGGTVVII